jgi:hypothetical protein
MVWRQLMMFSLVATCLSVGSPARVCRADDEPAPAPVAPSVPITVTTNAPPSLRPTPLPQPRAANIATSQPRHAEMPSAYGLGNFYPQPTDTNGTGASPFDVGIALPKAPTPATALTTHDLFSKSLQKPRLGLLPPPPPRTVPAPIQPDEGAPMPLPIVKPRTNAPPAEQDNPWKHRDKPLRDVEYKW